MATATKYDAVSARALATIARKGAAVAFSVVTIGVSDPSTGLPPSSTTSVATGSAVEIPGDPDVYAAFNLVLLNPITLLVAAKNLGVTPAPGMAIAWASKSYTIKLATPVSPDGVPVLWTIVAVV
jgi:hypothetical protein